jgi:hypothetical protein
MTPATLAALALAVAADVTRAVSVVLSAASRRLA